MSKSSTIKRKFTSCLALLALGASGSVFAESDDPRYTMTVIRDAAQGASVARGDYQKAIAKITNRHVTPDPFAESTNLCVAYAKTGEIDKATAACDTAIAIVREANWQHRSGVLTGQGEKAQRRYLAMALSNRGVLYAIRGDESSAERNFDEALKLDQNNDVPRVNLERLEAGAPVSA